MKHLMMALEYGRDRRQGVIALTQRRNLWNKKMFIGNQSQGQRRYRAQNLAGSQRARIVKSNWLLASVRQPHQRSGV